MNRKDAAALAGWSMNPSVPVPERLKASKQVLDLYVDQLQELRDLLEYLESKDPRDEDGDSTLGYYLSTQYEGPAYRDATAKLRRILDGE